MSAAGNRVQHIGAIAADERTAAPAGALDLKRMAYGGFKVLVDR